MSGEIVEQQFGGEVTRLYVSVAEDAVPHDVAFQDLEVLGQGKSDDERRAAAELEAVLDKARLFKHQCSNGG